MPVVACSLKLILGLGFYIGLGFQTELDVNQSELCLGGSKTIDCMYLSLRVYRGLTAFRDVPGEMSLEHRFKEVMPYYR